jgi:hypothetical protein
MSVKSHADQVSKVLPVIAVTDLLLTAKHDATAAKRFFRKVFRYSWYIQSAKLCGLNWSLSAPMPLLRDVTQAPALRSLKFRLIFVFIHSSSA